MYPISGYFSKLGAHITMLSDDERMNAYFTALQKAIIPGESVVVDIGTGTGVLAMMAARLGAKKVHAIEMGKIANIAEKLIRENALNNVITIHRGLSNDTVLPEKADIIVSETMGFTGFEESIVEIFADATRRLAKPNAILIPHSVTLYLAPTGDQTIEHTFLEFWDTPIQSIDFSWLKKIAANNMYSRQFFTDEDLVSQPQEAFTLSLGTHQETKSVSKLSYSIEKTGVLSGIVGWFSVDMGYGCTLNTKPMEKNDQGHWQQFFIPFEKNIEASKGNTLSFELEMEVISGLVVFSWKADLLNKNNVLLTQKGSIKEVLKALGEKI
jgi:protein arginine N-methyltransferase 1